MSFNNINHDCIIIILNLTLRNGFDYKSIIFTCKLFFHLLSQKHKYYVRKFSNHHKTILKLKGPPTGYDVLSDPIIRLELEWGVLGPLLNCLDKGSILYMSSILDIAKYNVYITHEIVNSTPEIDWYENGFLCNPNVSLNFLEENYESIKKYEYSLNPNMTLDFLFNHNVSFNNWIDIQMESDLINDKVVLNNINKHWDIVSLSFNKNISFDTLLTLGRVRNINIAELDDISPNYATMDNVGLFPWSWYDLAGNPNIPIDFMLENSEHNNFIFERIATRPKLCFDEIRKVGTRYWEQIARYNTSVDIDHLKDFLEDILGRKLTESEWFSSIVRRKDVPWDILMDCPIDVWNNLYVFRFND